MTQMDITEILNDIEQSKTYLGTHRRRIEAIMRHFAGAGLTLAVSADSRHLARSVSTLKGYARDLGLRFPDYVPWALRTDEEKKRKPKVAVPT